MRVALVCPYDLARPGGVRSHITGLGRALVARGHVVEIIAPSTATTIEGLPVLPCGASRGLPFGGTHIDFTWAPWRRVLDVSRRGYDVMHFHTIWNPLMPFQLATLYRGPKVATFHDVPSPSTPKLAAAAMPFGGEIVRRGFVDEVIAVSPVVSRYLAAGKHEVIPNGVWIPDPLPPEAARVSLLYLGRLEPRKGVATLVDALSILGDDAPPVRIAGDGYSRAALERAVAERGLSDVVFLGEVTEARKWQLLREASAVIAPSLGGESFGIVLLEAMAAGAIPIAADNPGYRHVLGERGGDLLFPAGDAPRLAARIREILCNDSRRYELQRWGVQYHRQFLWDAQTGRIEQVYRRAMRL
jgi:phosphatidyl-myo-inositol alpha-mannosyltransferase